MLTANIKKIIIPLLFSLFFLFAPSRGDAAYLIKLTNGNTITTSAWWEEEGFVKFYIYGGVAGIRKNTVRSIERSGRGSVGTLPAPRRPMAGPNGPEEIATPENREKTDPVIQEVSRLRRKSAFLFSMDGKELNRHYKEISSLRRRLFAERRDIVYQEQIKELSEMADTVEEAINQKRLSAPVSN